MLQNAYAGTHFMVYLTETGIWFNNMCQADATRDRRKQCKVLRETRGYSSAKRMNIRGYKAKKNSSKRKQQVYEERVSLRQIG